jgi:hypothetical protein
MAYEISEGAAAAAMFLGDAEYKACTGSAYVDGGTTYQSGEEAVIKVMEKLYDNLKNVVMSDEEMKQYQGWFNPNTETQGKNKGKSFLEIPFKGKGKDSKLTAVIHGCSAARGIKTWFKSMGHNYQPKTKTDKGGKVFVTGAGWDSDISFLKMTVNEWADYNSSDLVIILGNCYYGISLKKKPKLSSADPPMINKSVEKLLTEMKQDNIGTLFANAKAGFFGSIISKQMTNGGALAGSTIAGKPEDLFITQIKDPFKSSGAFINLINVKGEGKIKLPAKSSSGGKNPAIKHELYKVYDPEEKSWVNSNVLQNNAVRKLFGYVPVEFDKKGKVTNLKNPKPAVQSKWTMRKAVNNALGKKPNGLFKTLDALTKDKKIAPEVGKVLLNSILKTELQGGFNTLKETYKNKHFGFALVTALGEFKDGKITQPGNIASYKSDTTMQQTVASIIKAGEKPTKWIMRIDEATTLAKQERATEAEVGLPAKLFFQIGLKGPAGGFLNALDLELRYKGNFSPSPQFLGGISDYFKTILKTKDESKAYTFGKACGAL